MRRVVLPLPLLLRRKIILWLRLLLVRTRHLPSLWLVILDTDLIRSKPLVVLRRSLPDLLSVDRPLFVPVLIVDLNLCLKVYKILLLVINRHPVELGKLSYCLVEFLFIGYLLDLLPTFVSLSAEKFHTISDLEPLLVPFLKTLRNFLRIRFPNWLSI